MDEKPWDERTGIGSSDEWRSDEGATAHEISAFLERDLASSVVDEDDFADRSERPPTAAKVEGD
jgi:hypothetical protein